MWWHVGGLSGGGGRQSQAVITLLERDFLVG